MPRFFVKSCDSDSDSEDEFSDEDSVKINTFSFSDDEEEDDNCVFVSKREKNVRCEPEHEVTNLTGRWQRDTDNKLKFPQLKHTEKLEKLEQLAERNDLGVGMRVRVKYSIISALFDCQMERVIWNELLERTTDILRILNSHANVILNERVVLERVNKVEVEAEIPVRRFYLIHGCMVTVVEQLDVEFNKLLEETDVHSLEYANLLKDEKRICQIIDSLQSYVERLNFPSELCRLYLRKMEHLYSRIDANYTGLRQVETLRLMDRFSNFICSNEKRESICIRALLYQVYHLALHDKWNEAVAVMELFRLQDKVNRLGQQIKVLFNRTLVQLGLCAFRNGHMEEAHELLHQFHTRVQAEKLLGQNLRTRSSKQYPSMEQTPRHSHVDLQVLKCVYLVSAMLIEVPDMVADQTLSPNFQDFIHTEVVPYSAVEHIVAASRALSNGLWLDCCSYIINSKLNDLVWNSFHQAGKIRSMLVRKIKEQSLRTYLLTYSSKYDSLSLNTLTRMFKLRQAQVQSIVSEMIDSGEIDAFVDQVTQSVVMCRASQFRCLSCLLNSKLILQ